MTFSIVQSSLNTKNNKITTSTVKNYETLKNAQAFLDNMVKEGNKYYYVVNNNEKKTISFASSSKSHNVEEYCMKLKSQKVV
jgi:hypothetical protein